ncbi:MAG: tetratricopeptide repeat protein, partial [Pyrinomonadaceae bacterium]
MERAEFAARLVEVGNAEREALLRDHFALADVELAYILKDISLDGWSSNPARALAAAATLRLLSKLTTEPEIVALCAWAAGLAALITGEMEGAINQLEDAHQRFLALDKHHVAAATQVSKVIALSMLGRYDEAIASALHAREIFLAHGDLLAAGKIEHNIGNLYFRRDHYHEAEEFQTAARERFMTLRNQKQLATINNCLANTHAILHKFKSAEELYEQAVQQAESARVPVTQAEIEGNIGNFALLRGRYDQALDYLERSRRRYALLGMAHQSAISEQEIADAYLELNLVPEAAEIYARVTRTFADLG